MLKFGNASRTSNLRFRISLPKFYITLYTFLINVFLQHNFLREFICIQI